MFTDPTGYISVSSSILKKMACKNMPDKNDKNRDRYKHLIRDRDTDEGISGGGKLGVGALGAWNSVYDPFINSYVYNPAYYEGAFSNGPRRGHWVYHSEIVKVDNGSCSTVSTAIGSKGSYRMEEIPWYDYIEIEYWSYDFDDQTSGDGINSILSGGSTMLGIGAYHVGSHMQNVNRFRKVTQGGFVKYPATSRFRLGAFSGSFGNSLASGLRIGGGLLGAGGIIWNVHLLQTNQISKYDGWSNIASGAISFTGIIGMGIVGVYQSHHIFLKYEDSTAIVNEIEGNSSDGIWWGGHTHF
jgi:hypothetical protein